MNAQLVNLIHLSDKKLRYSFAILIFWIVYVIKSETRTASDARRTK